MAIQETNRFGRKDNWPYPTGRRISGGWLTIIGEPPQNLDAYSLLKYKVALSLKELKINVMDYPKSPARATLLSKRFESSVLQIIAAEEQVRGKDSAFLDYFRLWNTHRTAALTKGYSLPTFKDYTAFLGRYDWYEQKIEKREKSAQPVELTRKEIAVIELVPKGYDDYSKIAAYLGCLPGAVKYRMYNVRKKFGVAGINGAPAEKQLSKLSSVVQKRGYKEKEKPLLTTRKIEILKLVGNGLENKHIAAKLDIGKQQVANHKTAIFRSLGVQDATQAVVKAVSLGIVALGGFANEYNLKTLRTLYSSLSKREKEILADLANPENKPGDKEIGQRLEPKMSEQTVSNYLVIVSKSTHLYNRTQKALFYLACVKAGLTTPPSDQLSSLHTSEV